MLVINMAPDAVSNFLASAPAAFTDQILQLLRGRDTALGTFTTNAPQSVVLTSSVAMVGYTGLGSCMDFYYASPFSVQQLPALHKLSLEAVVRVTLSTGSLYALIVGLREAALRHGWVVHDE